MAGFQSKIGQSKSACSNYDIFVEEDGGSIIDPLEKFFDTRVMFDYKKKL